MSVDPTVLVKREPPERQLVELTIENGGLPFEGHLRVWAGDLLVEDIQLGEIKSGRTEAGVLLPERVAATPSRWALLDPKDHLIAEHRMMWHPPRHWKLHVIASSHMDTGLHAEQYKQRDTSARFIDEAMKLADQTEGWPAASRYRYVIEHMWGFLNYPADRTARDTERLIQKYVQPGLIGIGAEHSGNHTQEFGTEELCRSAYYARREARIRWGIDLEAAVFADINGLSWPLADVYSDAGIHYLGFFPNDKFRATINLSDHTPKLFYWLGPSGRSRVLVWAARHYTSAARDLGLREKNITAMQRPLSRGLRALEAEGPYDVWLVPNYVDNEEPALTFAAIARQWNVTWRWPELHTVGDPAVPFREVERRFGDQIPVLRGDITTGWAQHPVSTPDYLGRKRAADRLLTTAEKLATIARLNDTSFVYPTADFKQAWDSLISSDEHGYGVSPYTGKKVYVTWVHKRNWIDHALRVATCQSRSALKAIATKIGVTDAPAVVVFNPLLQKRTDLVSVAMPSSGGEAFQVVCADTGAILPTVARGGHIEFIAPDIPSLGYRVFRLVALLSAMATTETSAESPVLENSFYRIVFAHDGAIASIIDKELSREILDQKAPHKCNQFIFTSDDHKTFTSPQTATFEMETTAISRTVVARMRENRSQASIEQRVTVYADEKRIDIDNRLQRVAGLLHTPKYVAYGYYAFPIAVPNHVIRAELNGCIARPYDDQCPIGNFDWLAVQDWVDVSNSDFGITLAQRQSHLVEFGAIRTNRNSHDYRPVNPHLYSYLFNDWFQKNWPSANDVNLRYEYSIRSHRGDYHTGRAAEFGARFAYPLMATTIQQQQQGTLPGDHCSFLEIAAPNVELLTLKLSDAPGEGVIARFVESDGVAVKNAPMTLRWAGVPRMNYCSVVEDDRELISKPALDVSPFGITTVRLRTLETAALSAPLLNTRGSSDKAIDLAWTPVKGAVQYHVFRSSEERCPPDAYHLIAATTKPQLLDDWLECGVDYYYRVAAVSAGNEQGLVSASAKASTESRRESPPSQVGRRYNGLIWEPRAWHGDKTDTLHLLWGQNPESNVTHYELHRSKHSGFDPSPSTLIAKVPPGPFVVVSYDDSGLNNDSTYYYRVCAVDHDGRKGAFSAEWSGTTRADQAIRSQPRE